VKKSTCVERAGESFLAGADDGLGLRSNACTVSLL
jgi:hypothetical protein